MKGLIDYTYKLDHDQTSIKIEIYISIRARNNDHRKCTLFILATVSALSSEHNPLSQRLVGDL